MYNPNIPIKKIINPDNNQIDIIKLAQPKISICPLKYLIILKIAKIKADNDINKPNFIVSFKGLSEKANITSMANFIDFLREYDVLPLYLLE